MEVRLLRTKDFKRTKRAYTLAFQFISGFIFPCVFWVLRPILFFRMSCFMYMIDYYLLEAVVSFCIRQKQLPVFQKFACALFGSSWSTSDTALQVTCIVS